MIIQHLAIKNFRVIRTLDWHLQGRVLCLIGPNDSTKTTILDAIELVLMPRFNAQITDADFYQGNPTTPIVIEATVGELLPELIVDPDKFGLCLRGYDTANGILSMTSTVTISELQAQAPRFVREAEKQGAVWTEPRGGGTAPACGGS